jgi:hypothetical protein
MQAGTSARLYAGPPVIANIAATVGGAAPKRIGVADVPPAASHECCLDDGTMAPAASMER